VSGYEELTRGELVALLTARDALIVERDAQIVEFEAAQVAERDARLAELEAQVAGLRDQVDALQRRLDADSSSSSRPPSSDGPYRKRQVKSSPRKKSGRRPGKQPGAEGSTLRMEDEPDETFACVPGQCDCGQGLSGEPGRVERRQVVEQGDPPPPVVTEYQVYYVTCPACGKVACGEAPPWATTRMQYGPKTVATAAEVTCAQYMPIGRGTVLLNALTGLHVSTGFMAQVRSRAAQLVEALFVPVVVSLLATAKVLHVDETPARAAGKLAYTHIKTTERIALMHVGDRSAATIDADGILPAFRGVVVRDGYVAYEHLAALHAWCCAHLLRDLHAVAKVDDRLQAWALAMRDVLLDALAATSAARDAGRQALDAEVREKIKARYTAAYGLGLEVNAHRSTTRAADAYRLAKRFAEYQDMILRFVHDLDVPFTNNMAERDLRPVKVQQRTSGGAWRTLEGLADFALVRSYLATATKNGIPTIEALTRLFKGDPYLPEAA
jgi:transposase